MRFGFELATGSVLALLSLPASGQGPVLEHRCQGLTTDPFMSADGSHIWVAGDGGVIRYKNTLTPASPWVYQATPDNARDTLRRIFFLPDNVTGWAVGENGIVLRTINGGQTWTQGVHQFTPTSTSGEYDGFWDVHFISSAEGWIASLHGVWKTTTGASGFASAGAAVTLLDAGGNPIDPATIEIYKLDVLNCPGSSPVVIAVAEPGLVFRSTNAAGTVLQVVWDILQTCTVNAPKCGSGPLEPLIGQPMFDAVCQNGALFEPWDVEFRRTCDPNPLLVMVGGVGVGLGIVLSSTDMGTTWTRECHECEVNPTFCENSIDYKANAGSADRYWRLKFFWTLYGLALFPDGTGVASGYSGQHVVRQSNGVWVDRSSYSNNATNMDEAACPNAMNGAACSKGANDSITAGDAIIVGQGGHARVTDYALLEPNPTTPPNQSPENFTNTMPSTWWRLRATSFTDDVTGWRTGQMNVIARTVDGGVTWARERTSPYDGTGSCNSIAMTPGANPSSGGGVAVGEPDYRALVTTPGMEQNGTSFIGFPKILRRSNNPAPLRWTEPTALNFGPTALNQLLYDVVWAGTGSSGNIYWACGTGGLIIRSIDDGAHWSQVRGGALSTSIFFRSIAAKNSGELIAVGYDQATQVGVAVMLTGTSTGTGVASISVPSGLVRLDDVTIQGTTAYAAGTKIVGGIRTGVVLSALYTGGTFSTFSEINSPPAVACVIGNALGDSPPLNQIAITPNGDLWAGGECGRLWRFQGGPNWTEAKSQTDAHIVNMAVTPGGYIYITGARQNLTGSAIVRWKP